jgi:YD repeat-containing protein
MPYYKARLHLSSKFTDEVKGIEELKIWEVPVDEKNPDGIRYRLVYIPAGRKSPAVLYDNHHPKGHHKHIEGQEFDYAYSGVDKLIQDFKRDVEAIK